MDIAVVGAGPAGSLCAERLAAAGQRVRLFDPSHPREKPCGGGITPGIFDRLPELAALRDLGRPARRVRLRASGSRTVSVAIPRPIEIFSRAELDGALLERAIAAGAEHVPERVRRVRIVENRAVLEVSGQRLAFDFVIGADGAASVVRRCLLGERPGKRAGYATAGFWIRGLPEEEILIEFLPDVRGYLWAFPRRGHTSVGIAASVGHQNGAVLLERVSEWVTRNYPGSAGLARTRYAASIPCPSPAEARRPCLGGRGFALIGDAANQVDAITGEGIHHALDAAALLAGVLNSRGTLGAAQQYERAWQRGPGRELRVCARWARSYYRPASAAFMIRLGRRSSRARGMMADLLTAQQPYSTLWRRCGQELRGRLFRARRSTGAG